MKEGGIRLMGGVFRDICSRKNVLEQSSRVEPTGKRVVVSIPSHPFDE